jgi:hypothetical protein
LEIIEFVKKQQPFSFQGEVWEVKNIEINDIA